MNPDSFSGMQIVESVYCTETVTETLPRSRRERLWSWPWRPWVATRTTTRVVPKKGGFMIGPNKILMHPETVRRLREALATKEGA